MPHLHLTDLAVSKLSNAEGQRTYWDTVLPGFGIRVGKRRKTWTILVGKHRQRITIGHWPMPLKEARQKARAMLLRTYDDTPLMEPTIGAYCTQHLQPNTRPSSAREFERLLRKHYSHLGQKRLSDVTPRDITAVIAALRETPTEGNNAYRAINAFFNWCTGQHLLSASPVQHIRLPYKLTERDRVLNDDELRQILRATAHTGQFSIITRLLIHTAQRREQIAALKHSYISADTITWPKEAMKGNRAHTIPITPAIRQLLSQCSTDGEYLFPSNKGGPFLNWERGKKTLNLSIPHFTPHDYRRTTATNLRRLGVNSNTVEHLLHHKQPKVAGIYDRYLPLKEIEQALLLHDAWLTSLLA